MQTQELNFRKSRDFGDLLGDTFTFFKQEYKFFAKVLLFYAGPFVFVTAIASAWFQSGIFSLMGMMVSGNPLDILSEFGLKLLLYFLAAIISNTVLICVVYSYIGLYVEHGKDGFTQEDVWRNVGKTFFPVLGTMVVMGILIGIGTLLCIIPGIYLAIAFCLVFASVFFESLPMGRAFERSMFLIRDDWWLAFIVGVVIYLLVGFISYIFMLPSVIVSVFVTLNTVGGSSSGDYSILYMVFVAIGSFAVSIFACIPHITFSLFYYSQIEKKESPGLIDKIEKINKPETETENKPLF
jgi:hypothetical protein